jgi:hypothetical protein
LKQQRFNLIEKSLTPRAPHHANQHLSIVAHGVVNRCRLGGAPQR